MKAFENFLYGLFSAEVGVSEEIREEKIAKIRERIAQSEKLMIKKELIELFKDPNFDWVELLDGKYFFVKDVENNLEGKNFVLESVWKPLFPDEDPDSVK